MEGLVKFALISASVKTRHLTLAIAPASDDESYNYARESTTIIVTFL